VAVHEAQPDRDPGTFEEQSRRKFLANATLAAGGVISLVLAVPLVTSLVPESLIDPSKNGHGKWSDLPKSEFDKIAADGDPVKITFHFKSSTTDGYLPPVEDMRPVWGIKITPKQESRFRAQRPDLFVHQSTVNYPVITQSYVIFSSICPHLGCRFEWRTEQKRFICPCHGSQFGPEGAKLAGPAPRGLDPLPLREKNGQAQVTWIQYKSGEADRLIVAYS